MAAQSAPSVQHSLELIISRYDFWTNSGGWRLELRPNTFVLYWSRTATSPGDCALNEALQARTRGVIGHLMGQRVRVLEAGLQREAFGERRKLDDLLEVKVKHGQPTNYLVLPREYLGHAPNFGRAEFHDRLLKELDVRAFGGLPSKFSERLPDAFEQGMASHAGLSRQVVARHLGVSEGTLKRRLRRELGISYKAQSDRLVSREAYLQLVGTFRPIEQIADALGYTPSGFTRACRKWFGASPREIRNAHGPVPRPDPKWTESAES